MPFVFYFYFLRREVHACVYWPVLFFRKSVFTGTGSSALTLQAVLRRVEWRPERDVDAENSAGVDVTLTSSLLLVLQGPARWAMRRVTAKGPAQEVVARVPAESSSALRTHALRCTRATRIDVRTARFYLKRKLV